MLSGQQKKLPSTSDILFSSINFIILSNNMTMRILSEVTFPSEKKKKLSSWNSKRLLDYWQVNQVSNDMQHPEYEWWTKFQTSTDLTSNWAQQEGSACIPQIYFLQTKLPVHICIPLYKRGFENCGPKLISRKVSKTCTQKGAIQLLHM